MVILKTLRKRKTPLSYIIALGNSRFKVGHLGTVLDILFRKEHDQKYY